MSWLFGASDGGDAKKKGDDSILPGGMDFYFCPGQKTTSEDEDDRSSPASKAENAAILQEIKDMDAAINVAMKKGDQDQVHASCCVRTNYAHSDASLHHGTRYESERRERYG